MVSASVSTLVQLARNLVIARPLSAPGVAETEKAEPVPRVSASVTLVGALGTVYGVTVVDGADSADQPAAFSAATVQV